MSQIEINVLKQGTSRKKVIACSLFKMTNSYRDFSKYETNFKKFLENSKRMEDFEIRVYVDDTTKDIALKLSDRYASVSVYHYNCPPFREGEGHVGVFGMMPRFLPLFEKGLDVVWISDIDIQAQTLDPNLVNAIKKHNCEFFIDNVFCYQRKPWANVKYPIIAMRFVSLITFPKQIMTRFLNKVLNGDLNDLISTIDEYNARKSSSSFPYGLDEGFINMGLYNYLSRQNINILVKTEYFVQNMLSYNIDNFPKKDIQILYNYYDTHDPKLIKPIKDIYRKYLPNIVPKYPCIQELLDSLDDFKTTFTKVQVVSSEDI